MIGTLGKMLALCVVGFVGPVRVAWADAPSAESSSHLSRISLFGDIGYAYPTGAAETGSDTRDVSFGIVPLSVMGTYEFARNWLATARVRYAVNIPTLCSSAPDCESSLGRDVALSIGAGRVLPRRWHVTPQLGFEAGWEWLTTKLSDTGVVASRSWNGPFANLEVFADLRSIGPWSFGPAVGVDVGLFTGFDLETPAGHASGSTDATIHAWPTLSFRVGRRL